MALGTMLSVSAVAGEYMDALGSCFTDSTTGKDRKNLAAWVYVSMGQHPDIGRLAPISAEVREETFKTMGVLFTRLLSENCASQARDAMKHEGSNSPYEAWTGLMKLAMQELTSNPDVFAAITSIGRYSDLQKIRDALEER